MGLRIGLGLAYVALLVAPLACAASRHTVPPYAIDTARAEDLEQRAAQRCVASGGRGRRPPQRTFKSDGCSWWLDGSWAGCCIEHDQAYWCGGTAAERKRADRELRACLQATPSAWSADLVYLGVRLGGHPALPTPYRWGYGRAYMPSYPGLAEPRSTAR